MISEDDNIGSPNYMVSSQAELYEESDTANRNMRMKAISQQYRDPRPGKRKIGLNAPRLNSQASIKDDYIQSEDIITKRKDESNDSRFVVINGRPVDVNCEDLNFCFAAMTEVPQALAQLPLKHLNLSFNRISAISAPLSKFMNSLMFLELSNNKLKVFPSHVQQQLRTLTTLNLAYNRLAEYPVDQGNMPDLVSLNILSNCIRSLPKRIIDTKLQKLIIEWKVFKESPDGLSFLSNLDYLGNSALSYTANDLKRLFRDSIDLTCEGYIVNDLSKYSKSAYWAFVHNSLRLKSYGLLQALIDARPQAILYRPVIQQPSLLLWAIEAADEVFIEYLASMHPGVFEKSIKEDPGGDLLQYIMKNK